MANTVTMELMCRQLEVAVSEEDYQGASSFKAAIQKLVNELSPVQQYVHKQFQVLRQGSLQEQVGAIRSMGKPA